MNLLQYIKTQPHGTLRKLSNEIGAHAPDVSRWASSERPIPIHRAVAIERATGGAVTRQDMFPEKWREMWPELADKAPR